MSDIVSYRFDVLGAFDAGEDRHPQIVIMEIAPGATNLVPESIADCWTFEAPRIASPPPYVESLPLARRAHGTPMPGFSTIEDLAELQRSGKLRGIEIP